jgi:formylmethanofuran dehydrogenase subunit D
MSFYKFLVPKLEVTISIIRTYEQEVSEFIGKDSDEYKENAAVCFLSEEDFNELGIKEDTNVKVSTNSGSVVLKVKKSDYAIKGIAFVPIGIWANRIVPMDFEDEGHIKYKNLKGYIEATEDKIKSYEELKQEFV